MARGVRASSARGSQAGERDAVEEEVWVVGRAESGKDGRLGLRAAKDGIQGSPSETSTINLGYIIEERGRAEGLCV